MPGASSDKECPFRLAVKTGKPGVLHTQGATAPSGGAGWRGSRGVPYPPPVLVHPSPAIITTVETVKDIATC